MRPLQSQHYIQIRLFSHQRHRFDFAFYLEYNRPTISASLEAFGLVDEFEAMDEVEQIKQKLNIVDLIQEYLPLKKSGINFKANCPFHGERTPSFMVSPERGIWRCFGCQRGGDIFKFLMEKEFKEALEILAKKAGAALKVANKKDKDQRERLFEVNQKAQQFFSYILTEHPLGKAALAYLKKRGLSDETIKNFGIGYAPLSWESLARFMRKRGFSNQELIESGLTVPSNKGSYDRFRGRIMFPLSDLREHILGFSGRILGKGEPKYINCPQTIIFDKSKFLFGIHLAKSSFRESQEAILVEGEMDMILSFQTGVKNIVASKGTALTEGQLELLKRYCDTLSLCFDTDLAGDSASRRGIEMADKMGFNLKVIQLKGAKDPADVCLTDPTAWEEAVSQAIPIYDYYLDSSSQRFDPKSASGKRQIYSELLPIWRKITDPVVKDHYIQKLAALLQVKDELIRKDLTQVSLPSQNVAQVMSSSSKDDQIDSKNRQKLLEEYLLGLLLHLPQELTFVPNFPETIFTQEDFKQIFVLLVLYLDSISFQGKGFKITDFIQGVPGDLTARVDELYLLDIDEKLTEGLLWQKEIVSVVGELKKILIKASLEKLSYQIKTAQEFDNIETLETLNKRFRDLSVKLKNL